MVIAIISILIMMLLPAVQAVREAARATSCRNKIRQIGIGLQSFESSHGAVPGSNRSGHSFMVGLLPYLEHNSLYEKLDLGSSPGSPHNVNIRRENPIQIFSCPSQTGAGNSYVGCMGTAWLFSNRLDRNDSRDGLFGVERFARVTDGLSNTIAVSESGPGTPSSYIRIVPADARTVDVKTMDTLLFSTPATTRDQVVGGDWASTAMGDAFYNHYLPPNQRSGFTAYGSKGVYSSSSHHPGGINSARVDGSVFFVSDSIDRNMWLQLGSAVDGQIDFEGY